MRTLAATIRPAVVLLAALMLLSSCGGDEGGPNIAPDTAIQSAPPQGSTTSYRVSIEWTGSDPDGYVPSYEVAFASGPVNDDVIAGLGWTATDATESTFTVLADSCCKEAQPYRSHTFFVRAVDNEGAKDATPAHTSFNATTLLPTSRFNFPPRPGNPPAVTLPGCVTLGWTGEDADGRPVEYQYCRIRYSDLLGPDPPPYNDSRWSPWSTATQLTIRLTQDDPGNPWAFFVRAKDNAGAAENVFDSGRNFILVYIDESATSKPTVSICCNEGTCTGKAGPLVGCRSSFTPGAMDSAFTVAIGDTVCFRATFGHGPYASEVTDIAFLYNDSSEPGAWRDATRAENWVYPPEEQIFTVDSNINVVYVWVKDDYCEGVSTAVAYITLNGVPRP